MLKTTDDRNPLELAAEEFAERLRRGEFPTVDEYVQRFPQHADELIELLPTVAAMENLRTLEDLQRLTAQSQGMPLRARQCIDDFELVRIIGRGGMGVVYEAEQRSLHRRVALKILAASVASSENQIARFRREAEAAARLHHTNIVPVFGSGEHEDLHYYVMQLIDGSGLDEVIVELRRQLAGDRHSSDVELLTERVPSSAERAAVALRRGVLAMNGSPAPATRPLGSTPPAAWPSEETRDSATTPPQGTDAVPEESPQTVLEIDQDSAEPTLDLGRDYWRSVARLGVQLADALYYAHRQGILHRDIKPGNLLLDHNGVVWITDFGLAKHEDLEGVTRSGDTLGTLRYMAPEQLGGQADARSDIYALGLTLYELLTLRPAFEDTQFGEVVRKKTTTDPRRPRSLNSQIPRDLETIVLKACASAPEDRYPNAGELKADFQRFLEDRPILARAANAGERLFRWSRRNPALAILSGGAACLLVTIAVVLGIGNYRMNRALQRVELERSNAHLENARAEANLYLAVRAFEDIIRSVADRGALSAIPPDGSETEPLPQEAVVTEADAALLRRLLGFFDQFALQNRANLQEETARAHRCIGDIHHRLGQLEQAEAAYQVAIDTYREIVRKHPQNTRCILAEAEVQNDLASAIMKLEDGRRAFAILHQARDLLEGSPTLLKSREGKFQLARTLNLLGTNRVRPGRRISDERGQGPSSGGQGRNQGRAPPAAEGVQATLEQFALENEQAGRLLAELVADDPSNAAYRFEQIQWYRNQIGRHLVRSEFDLVEEARAVATERMEQAVRDFPQMPDFQYALGDSLMRSIWSSRNRSDQPEVQERLDRIVAIARSLCAAHPQVPEYPALLASGLSRQAELKRGANEYPEALALYEEALKYLQPLAVRFRTISRYQLKYSSTLHDLADVQRQLGDHAACLAALQQSVSILAAAYDQDPENWFVRRILRDRYRDLAAALEREGQMEAAAEVREKSRAIGGPDAGRDGSGRHRGPPKPENSPQDPA